MLLVRAGGLGDLLLLRRALAALQAVGHRPSLLAPARLGAALHGCGPGEVGELLDWEAPGVAALLGEERPGPWREWLGGFESILAYTRNPDLLRGLRMAGGEVVAHDPSPPSGHASRWLAQPVRGFGADPEPLPPPLLATREEEEAAAPLLRRLPADFLALHPGSGSATKNWPWDRFLALAAALSADRPWLLVQGPAEADLHLDAPRSVAARALPLRVLGALLARAGLYVGNDSGVSHLAAAWAAPTVTLFGPTDPEVWSPLGPRVRNLRARGGVLSDLSLAEVVAAGRALR